MARINDFENLSKLLNVLASIDSGYISYSQLASKMECSKKEAEKTVLSICQSEVGGLELGISIVESDEDLAEILEIAWISGDRYTANQVPKSVDEPGIFVNINSKLLGSKPRLTFEESWALLLSLAFGGIDSETELSKKLESAACQFDFDSHTQAVDAVCEIEDYLTLKTLALLCAQHRLAVIEYEQTKNVDSQDENVEGTSSSSSTGLRKILPLEIYTDTNGQMYLFAHQYEKKIGNSWLNDSSTRVFKVSRIVDIEPLAQHEKNEQILKQKRTTNQQFLQAAPTARLAITNKCFFDKRTWINAEIVDIESDNFILEMPLHSNTAWISRSIASRLGEATVMKPTSLSKDVSNTAKNILEEINQLEAELEQLSAAQAQA